MDVFAPYLKFNGCFIVQNISPQIKTIKIFQYPINYGRVRDLLQIPGVAESDIRASLLKGELQHKIRARDIVVICSDIDLLQFNNAQKMFLQSAGIVNGLSVSGSGGSFNATSIEIDVGQIPIYTSTINIIDSSIISTSKILVWQDGLASTMYSDDPSMDNILCTTVAKSGSFDLFISAVPGPIVGKRKINYVIST